MRRTSLAILGLTLFAACGLIEPPLQQTDYDINPNVEEVYPLHYSPPAGWVPNLEISLDAALPRPWPEQYIEEYEQAFNPHAFFTNAAMLCAHFNQTGDDRSLEMMSRLFDRFLEYTEERDGALFVAYRFERSFRGVSVDVPWTSGYSSGAALIGLTILEQCGGIDAAGDLAPKVVEGMARIIDLNDGDRPDLWVSFKDDGGFLWFEEMPLPQREQPRILNGHIRALTGLYRYWAYSGDEEALRLLRAGITTVERYVPDFRNPGTINHYDLWQKRPDYGPERTIDQQGILYRMTGDPIFAEYRDMFESDMRDDIEAIAEE